MANQGSYIDDSPIAPDGDPSRSAQTASLGQTLSAGMKLGRYTILEPLGSGGMGAVYRARDEKLERAVAIKILSPGMLNGPEARLRFRKEALALAKLSHPHIAAVYDAGEQDGVDYIVMECVQGQTLAAKLKAGPLPVKDATSIALQIAQALEEAHEQGVVHRDLKPANVMITPKGHAKVLDFGLAKLLSPAAPDATLSMETGMLIGTPLYMSPEQAQGERADAQTDLWSLGVVYYESLTCRTPFRGIGHVAVLHAIIRDAPEPLRPLRPDAPAASERIVSRALEKSLAKRYRTAAEMALDASELLTSLSAASMIPPRPDRVRSWVAVAAVCALLATIAAAVWYFHRSSQRQWAREEAVPQIANLIVQKKPLAAFAVLAKARSYLPGDPQLKQIARENTLTASITSSPSGAVVELQDYAFPESSWVRLGTTPLKGVSIPTGYFRWKVSKSGAGGFVVGLLARKTMDLGLGAALGAPSGMTPVPGGNFIEDIDFVGFVGPYKLPPYFIDRYEVTNLDYQKFVDSGGYRKKEYWTGKFIEDGREISWGEAMQRFRDPTGRPGPSTWVAGHYPEGKGDYPVSGVSWYEASAYAAFAGKSLPLLAQWYRAAPSDLSRYIVPVSNISASALAPVGAYRGVGPYGTYDMAGNVREWAANPDDAEHRFILGGSWKSPAYLYFDPETLSPFDRSDANGFRCVKNAGPVPEAAAQPIRREVRDFSKMKPVSDDVFRAYELLYASSTAPLHETDDGTVNEAADWREEKVSFDTGYRGERMSAYLFLPKNVKPPYQTVLFFPSARVDFIPDNKSGTALGDIRFFDYVVQSGRAVMYPIYQDTYERRIKYSLPRGSQNIQLTTDRYKDAARSLDYLATRADIDHEKLAYLGVSMGSAEGVIYATLLQDRLKTAVFLDGGYFLDKPSEGGDQAVFAPRMKKPVLMVNGRYDYVFSLELAQNPMFSMLGTPEKDKRHVILETPHDVEEQRPQLVRAVLDWLDRYMGRVGQ